MTAKIEFFYTHGHSYTASGVNPESIDYDDTVIQYTSLTTKELLDIHCVKYVTVQKHDLKFAIVTFGKDDENEGSTMIIHGLANKFDISATMAEAEKVVAHEKAEIAANERAKARREKEAAKYIKRRQARSEFRKHVSPHKNIVKSE